MGWSSRGTLQPRAPECALCVSSTSPAPSSSSLKPVRTAAFPVSTWSPILLPAVSQVSAAVSRSLERGRAAGSSARRQAAGDLQREAQPQHRPAARARTAAGRRADARPQGCSRPGTASRWTLLAASVYLTRGEAEQCRQQAGSSSLNQRVLFKFQRIFPQLFVLLTM